MNVFEKLRAASTERAKHWRKGGSPPPISFSFMELAGEVGEACNAGKKLARHEMGWVGGSPDLTNLKEELADVIICTELVASHYNIDLWEAVVDKFNKTSEKHNFPVKLEKEIDSQKNAKGNKNARKHRKNNSKNKSKRS